LQYPRRRDRLHIANVVAPMATSPAIPTPIARCRSRLSPVSTMGAADNGGAVATGSSGISAGSTAGAVEPVGSVLDVVAGPNVATVDSVELTGGTVEMTSEVLVVSRASPTPKTSTVASPGSNSPGTTT